MGASSRDHRLWVPMQIQSLVFGRPGSAAFLDLTPRYEELTDTEHAPLGRHIRPNLRKISPRPPYLRPGIHLHWMLPAAFTHLQADSSDPPPRAPNRWLVTRIWMQDGRLELRCKLVESDSIAADDDVERGSVAWFDERLDPSLTMGMTRNLADWHEPGTANPGFSAFAPGNLGFSASYPACRGVFGYHDDCRDLPAGTLCTYLVAGWFSDPAADPLNITDPAKGAWAERMEKLRWRVTGDPPFLPAAVTCHAIAARIRWTPDAACTSAAQRDLPVAIGRGFNEAVAALARRNGSKGERDGFVKFHQLAILDERRPTAQDLASGLFQDLDRMPAAQARQHQRGFAARDGGTFWEIVSVGSATKAAEGQAPMMPSLPPDLAPMLAELNSRQSALDAEERSLAAARERLFLAWSQHQFWTIRPVGKATEAEALSLANAVAACTAEVRQHIAALPQLQRQRDIAKDGIATRLDQETPRAFDLLARAMPRFWRPADPFILTSGLDIPMMQGGASRLLCRFSNQTIPRIGGRLPVSRSTLRGWLEKRMAGMKSLPPGNPDLPPDWTDLLLDTLFLDSGMAGALALAALSTTSTDPDEAQIAAAEDKIAAAQKPVSAAAEAINRGGMDLPELPFGLEDGVARALLSAFWPPSMPPRPVFLVWQASWRRLATEGWTLADDATDLTWSGETTELAEHMLDGVIPLATGLERGLDPAREQFPDQAFAFRGLDRLAGQTLAGLTDALATRDIGAQLTPLRREGGKLRPDPVGNLLGAHPLTGPLTGDSDPSPFSPMRGGDLVLTRLWIVDNFGRVQRLLDTEDSSLAQAAPAISRAIPGLRAGSALLPPRLVQHARIRLDWKAAREGGTDTSPICGFVLHNRLDRCLLFYEAGASPSFLGALQPVRLAHGQEVIRWSALPARAGEDDANPSAPLTGSDIPDPRLRGFVNGLLAGFGDAEGRGFEDFRTLLAQHDEGVDFTGDQALQSMLTGRPLALVRAELRIEMDAPPVGDQHRSAVLEPDPTAPPWFRGLAFAARLGDRRLGPEGLLGAFIDDGGGPAFRTLRPRPDLRLPPSLASHGYFDRRALSVPADPAMPPLSVVLLIDPRRPLNLVTGILPAASFHVPRDTVTASASSLEIPFLVAPILGEAEPSSGRAMPLPTGSHDEWRWAGFSDRKSPATDEPVGGDTAAAGRLQVRKALDEGWLRYCPTKRGT